MKVIDAHTHIFPDKIAHKASASIGDFYGYPAYDDASSFELLKSGKRIDARHFLVCSSAVTAHQVESINDFIAEECKKHDCFTGFCAMHPDFENFEEELDRAIENGLKGVKFHPDFQKFNIDDRKVYPIYKAIAKRNLPILMHMGDKRYDFSAPERLAHLVSDIPELRVIAAHFGGYSCWDRVKKISKDSNVVFDTSSSLGFLEKDKVLDLIEHFGTDKFFFGTDFPIWEPCGELEKFFKLGLSEDDNEKILYKNFCEYFNVTI